MSGRMGGSAQGLGGTCYCPNCGYTIKHNRAIPCMDLTCPHCKTKLSRG